MQRLLCCLLLITLFGCKEKYLPKLNETTTNYLVVEGFINAGSGPTNFRLSRTLKIIDSFKSKPELGAVVTVQGSDNSRFTLVHKGDGVYSADQLSLVNSQQYRLHIRTSNGKEYTSDYVPVKRTPVIDSVSWVRTPHGVQISVSTHDVLNQTKYYKWEYEETWEQQSVLAARLDWRNNQIVEIDPYQEKIIYCWRTLHSSNLLIGTTAALGNDVMHMAPIHFIPNATERLGVRYSILVRQYALTKEAHEFFKLMRKNTEELGSIFGPLPSAITGNIRNAADPNEIVIGFVTAATAEEKRIFISTLQVPDWGFQLGCGYKQVDNNVDSIDFYFRSKFYRPYDDNKDPSGVITFYYGITPLCADCRLRGGTNVKPAFW